VESGEGIERQVVVFYIAFAVVPMWNPVKELKDDDVEAAIRHVASQWNPVKELKA